MQHVAEWMGNRLKTKLKAFHFDSHCQTYVEYLASSHSTVPARCVPVLQTP